MYVCGFICFRIYSIVRISSNEKYIQLLKVLTCVRSPVYMKLFHLQFHLYICEGWLRLFYFRALDEESLEEGFCYLFFYLLFYHDHM